MALNLEERVCEFKYPALIPQLVIKCRQTKAVTSWAYHYEQNVIYCANSFVFQIKYLKLVRSFLTQPFKPS